jgi:hypothetical protein
MGEKIGNMNFLSLGGNKVLNDKLEDVQVVLDTILRINSAVDEIGSPTPQSSNHKSQDNGVYDELLLQTVESNSLDKYLIPKIDGKFLCAMQYDSEVEFENILQWTHDSTDSMLKISRATIAAAHDIEVDQLEKLSELKNWRNSLFSR